MVEAFVRFTRDLDVAERSEQSLVFGQYNAYAQLHPRQLAATGFVFDGVDQAAGDAEAPCRGHDRQPAEIEVVLHELDHDAADDLAIPLGDDRAGLMGELGGDPFGSLAEGTGFGLELAAILLERGGDGGSDGRSIGYRRGAQDKGVAHGRFLT